MDIKISHLELINFKCFRHKEIAFDTNVVTIKGRNGVGKTTIADAILFCLFGKNTEGQSDLNLFKTRENGLVIPNIDHSVEMKLVISGDNQPEKVITLKRSIKEVWGKKRSSEEYVFKNNTVEYLVNGESYLQDDYKKYVSSIVSENIFRTITSPSYFLSLNWQTQRDFLAQMVGNVAPEEIATTPELANLVNSLEDAAEGVDVVAYRKHLSYQIKKIKEAIDRIPIRLEEQNKALPERLDWDTLEAEKDKAQQEIEEIDKNIISIKAGNGDDIKRVEIRKQLQENSRKMSDIESRTRHFIAEKENQKNSAVTEAACKFTSLLNTQRDLEQSISSFSALKRRCQDTITQCEDDANEIRAKWYENLKRSLQFTDSDCICPTCGQYLPSEQVDEKRRKAKEVLNADKARIKADLTAKAEKVKKARSDAEKEIESYDTQRTEAEKKLAETKELINQAFSEKAKIEKDPIPLYSELLAGNDEYQQLLNLEKTLNDKIEIASSGDEDNTKKQLDELTHRKQTLTSSISTLNTQLATRSQYEKNISLIEGINKEQKDLIKQLSELEKKDDIACQYQDRQNAILEERVNRHFTLVKWKMFRTINNSGDAFQEPFCECLVDGIPYGGGLNKAKRLNAGLDVINAICKHYNITAPIVIDNAESTLNILQTDSQQIRLEVADINMQIL